MKQIVKSLMVTSMILISSFVSAEELLENQKSWSQLNEQQIMDEPLETDSDNEDVETEHA